MGPSFPLPLSFCLPASDQGVIRAPGDGVMWLETSFIAPLDGTLWEKKREGGKEGREGGKEWKGEQLLQRECDSLRQKDWKENAEHGNGKNKKYENTVEKVKEETLLPYVFNPAHYFNLIII